MRKPSYSHALLTLLGIVVCLSALAACSGEPTSPIATIETATANGPGGGALKPAKNKVDICHVDEAGVFRLITVSVNAEAAHLAHGDAKPGDPVPGHEGFFFEESCLYTLLINLDGKVDGFGFASKVFFFPAGTFELTPIGVADGGAFDAVDTWAGRPPPKWEWAYMYGSPSLGSHHIWDWIRYETPAEALANGVTHSFTLVSAEDVEFGVNDCPGCLGDNSGGISIMVVQIGGMP